jgi:hypothetical protein
MLVSQVDTIIFTTLVVRKTRKKTVWLLLGYQEGNTENVVGMFHDRFPNQYSALKRESFRHVVQSLTDNQQNEGADEIRKAMALDNTYTGYLIEFPRLHNFVSA